MTELMNNIDVYMALRDKLSRTQSGKWMLAEKALLSLFDLSEDHALHGTSFRVIIALLTPSQLRFMHLLNDMEPAIIPIMIKMYCVQHDRPMPEFFEGMIHGRT